MKIFIFALVTSFFIACGGGGSQAIAVAQPPSTQPSVISQVNLYPAGAALNQGSGSINVSVTVFFSVLASDVTAIRIISDSVVTDTPISLKAGTFGATGAAFRMDTSRLGPHAVEVHFINGQLQVSRTASSTFQVGPGISLTNPKALSAGGPALSLEIQGTGFTTNSAVQWNNSPRATTFVSSTLLRASISTQDIASVGTAQVLVLNPDAEGGTSTSFAVPISNLTIQVANTPVNDFVWDPVHSLIFASTPGSIGVNGNSILVIDPASGSILNSVNAGSEPNRLGISDDSQFLYVSLDGSSTIKRFTLPGLVSDLSIPLGDDPTFGPYYGLDIQVAPGAPHTIAVALGCQNLSVPAKGGIVIYDDATPRLARDAQSLNAYSTLQWGPDASTLHSADNESTSFSYFALSVDAGGVHLTRAVRNSISAFGSELHFDRVNGLIYADSGQVLTPGTAQLQGTFQAGGRMTSDHSTNLAFFANSNPGQTVNMIYLSSFRLDQFTPLGSASLSWGSPYTMVNRPRRILKTLDGRLAMGGNGLPVFLLSGPFVNGL